MPKDRRFSARYNLVSLAVDMSKASPDRKQIWIQSCTNNLRDLSKSDEFCFYLPEPWIPIQRGHWKRHNALGRAQTAISVMMENFHKPDSVNEEAVLHATKTFGGGSVSWLNGSDPLQVLEVV